MLKIRVCIFVREEHWAANYGRTFSMDFLIILIFLIYYSISTLRGVYLSVVMSSRYVLPLQKDENLEGTVYRWHEGTSLQALG
jgi:hypothetical protein